MEGGAVTYTHVMHKSKFCKVIKVRKNQLEWIKENKILAGCKTDAGFLDIIINNYKKYELRKMRNRVPDAISQAHNIKGLNQALYFLAMATLSPLWLDEDGRTVQDVHKSPAVNANADDKL